MSNEMALVVDDDKFIRESMSQYFTAAGYRIITAPSGEDALEILKSDIIDVVITDIILPGINGLELTEVIKRNYNSDVVVMTGYSGDYSYQEAINKGASDFVFKPFRFEELILRFRRVLKDRKITLERMRLLDSLQKQISQDDLIVRCIEFPPEYLQAGISVLSYFGRVLQNKYPGKDTKVKIEQEGFKVTMIIEYPEGGREIFEKTLSEYGLVITGQMQPDDFSDDKLFVIELKNQLMIAKTQLEMQKNILSYQNEELKKKDIRIDRLISLLGTVFQHQPNCEITIPVTASSQATITQQITLNHFAAPVQDIFYQITEHFPSESKIHKRIQEIQNELTTLKDKPPEIVSCSKGMAKLQKLIGKMQNAENSIGKAIRTVKDGMDLGQKLARHYNSIAQWCGLPQIPTVFVK